MTGTKTATALFAGHRFHFVTDAAFEAVQARYLRAFVPGHRLVPPCGEETAVRVRRDAALFEDRMARVADAASLTVVPFRGEPYRRCRIDDVTWWWPAPDTHLPLDHLYARDASGRQTVLLKPGAERGERYLMRVVREIVLRCSESRGWTSFHAAAAALDDRGMLIAAPSRAGKTTVLTALAAHHGADLIASDRALVTADAGMVTGVPISVRIGGGTLSALAPRADLPIPHTVPAAFGSGRKAALTPREFARAFSCRVRETAPLRLVVVPRLRDDDQPLSSRTLDAARARTLLAAVCCTPYDEDWLEPWFAVRTRPVDDLAGQAAVLIDSLAATLPVLRVTAGVHSPGLLEKMAATVTGRLT
ncbi:hypothetical protein GCM10027160_17330 [Streptomyces calidiresistens]|uniref:HPr kinase n=1 Tax=Streptomyces calidiresistens TaxID=1485586 RepID=A0A7W3XUR3_9ACTN|nr:hypothetical protein [Streptomyces calidiresistens]MBB0228200.1 hypothetical protein [Streptomyces calidiresistens]